MWATQDPVTLFGAATSKSGADEVRQFFRKLASQFSNCTAYRFELVAALGGRRELLAAPAALAPEAGHEQKVGETSAAAETTGVAGSPKSLPRSSGLPSILSP